MVYPAPRLGRRHLASPVVRCAPHCVEAVGNKANVGLAIRRDLMCSRQSADDLPAIRGGGGVVRHNTPDDAVNGLGAVNEGRPIALGQGLRRTGMPAAAVCEDGPVRVEDGQRNRTPEASPSVQARGDDAPQRAIETGRREVEP